MSEEWESLIPSFQNFVRRAHGEESPIILNALSQCLHARFKSLGRILDLDDVIERLEAAVELTPDDRNCKPNYLNRLGTYLHARFERTDKITDLNSAIEKQQIAVTLIPSDCPEKPKYLANIGAFFLTRFSRLGDISDLQKGNTILQEAVSLTPDGHPYRVRTSRNLATALYARWRHLGDPMDLENAIIHQRTFLSLPDDDPIKGLVLADLGAYLQERYKCFGNVEDINQAIEYKQAACELIPGSHPFKPASWNHLGTALQARFLHFGNPSDIDDAIKYKQNAVDLASASHSPNPLFLSNLGNSLERRFEFYGHLEDLNKSLTYKKNAVEIAPDGHAEKHRFLMNLGKSLYSRWVRLGSTVDLDDAVASDTAAVELLRDGHPDKPMALNNLGNSLSSRSKFLDSPEDMDKAISCIQSAINVTKDNHPEKPILLSSLAGWLHGRFLLMKKPEYIENAVKYQRHALLLTPDGHLSKADYWNGLGVVLSARYECFKNMRDLEESIQSHLNAVEHTVDGNSSMARYLNHLGLSMERRFEDSQNNGFSGNISDINTIISQQRQAVDLTPAEDLSKARYLMDLGRLLLKRFRHFKRSDDAEETISRLSDAAKFPSGQPAIRFQAVDLWIAHALDIGHHTLLAAYECALDIIPLIAWLGLPIANRHRRLTKIGGITREAVAAAIAHGMYDKAVEWLEQGRSVVWNQILQLRSPVNQLREVNPRLAERLLHVSQQLNKDNGHEASSYENGSYLEERGRRYRALITDWEAIVKEVRSMPNFEDFLKSPSAFKLKNSFKNDLIVVLNVSSTQCDALALLPGSKNIIHIPLPDITYEKLNELHQDLKDSLSSYGIRVQDTRAAKKIGEEDGEATCKHILTELWSSLVKPILDSLKFAVFSFSHMHFYILSILLPASP
jgi:tetratricopeptide (TPR) repeat protein